MNCKPPCMAIIIRAEYRDLIGLPVEVIAQSTIDDQLGFCWHVRASREMPCWDNRRGRDAMSKDLAVPDRDLRPITGLPIDEETREELTA